MSLRPTVSVVMPFAGSRASATAALATLRGLRLAAGDERILADNSGTVPLAGSGNALRVVRAAAERSPAHARNAGAATAGGDWLLFLDADVGAPADLVERYFAAPVGAGVGALAGGIAPAPGGRSLAARYGAAKSFLDTGAHLAHPYLPRAAAANLLVRREAFDALGGFLEGLRAAEDTDLCWRLQRAGWRLEGRPEAVVDHHYRASLGALRRQWRGYAAGRAWLGRRYPGFAPEPALLRAARRRRPGAPPVAGARGTRANTAAPGRSFSASAPGGSAAQATGPSHPSAARPLARAAFLAVDVVLGLEELAGFALSNRPPDLAPWPAATRVLVAECFPVPGDPLVSAALARAAVEVARTEALARPERIDGASVRALRVAYHEDDGVAARVVAAAALLARHPLRAAGDRARRPTGAPPLTALAPAAVRLARDPDAVIAPLDAAALPTARRLAALAGRRLETSA